MRWMNRLLMLAAGRLCITTALVDTLRRARTHRPSTQCPAAKGATASRTCAGSTRHSWVSSIPLLRRSFHRRWVRSGVMQQQAYNSTASSPSGQARVPQWWVVQPRVSIRMVRNPDTRRGETSSAPEQTRNTCSTTGQVRTAVGHLGLHPVSFIQRFRMVRILEGNRHRCSRTLRSIRLVLLRTVTCLLRDWRRERRSKSWQTRQSTITGSQQARCRSNDPQTSPWSVSKVRGLCLQRRGNWLPETWVRIFMAAVVPASGMKCGVRLFGSQRSLLMFTVGRKVMVCFLFEQEEANPGLAWSGFEQPPPITSCSSKLSTFCSACPYPWFANRIIDVWTAGLRMLEEGSSQLWSNWHKQLPEFFPATPTAAMAIRLADS